MKFLFTFITVFSIIIGFSQDVEKIKIPKGVVYNYADADIVEKAKALITADIADKSKYEISGKILIVGPQLWKRFQKIKPLKEIKGGNTTFMVDGAQLKGKMTQNVEDSKKIWDQFLKEIENQDFIIRKANEKELKYYWSVISFDIDEPLLILDTNNRKYILNLSPKDMKLMWLDEAP